VNFYFDGELRGSVDATLFKHTPMSIWLTTLGWSGPIDDTLMPSDAQFDYVRLFTKPSAEKPATLPATAATTEPKLMQTEAEAKLVAEIRSLGGIVKTEEDAADGAVVSITFTYTHATRSSPGGAKVPPYEVTDDLVKQIARLPRLTSLELNMCPKLTEASFKEIGGMTQLTHLALPGPCVTDAGMADLAGLTKLEYLRMSGAMAVTVSG